MDNGKYIIAGYRGCETPVLFPCFVNHSDIAKIFGGKEYIISAGFFEVGAKETKEYPKNISVCVFGKSETLNKEVNKDYDPILIQKLLRKQDSI